MVLSMGLVHTQSKWFSGDPTTHMNVERIIPRMSNPGMSNSQNV